jgi:putative oxidoreductase
MTDTTGSPKLLFPGLAGFYESVSDLWYPMVRIAIGCILFMHGWIKVTGPGLAGMTGYFTKNGFAAPEFFAFAAIFLETVGAACIVLGLFTRFFAAALAIELGVAFWFIHLPHGFPVGGGGFEYVLLLGIVMFAIALRGGGPYSVDRMIGKEL